jgi:acetolactate synthase-1/2/3 large subunit
VVCFTGDGGFWYHLSELETACRCNIKTVTIVNNNNCLKQCWDGVAKAYGQRSGNKDELFRFREVNFARIAQEMGCTGIRVERPEKIGEVLEEALTAEKPVVIDVLTDAECEPPAPWSP